jgi:hypothetical protein
MKHLTRAPDREIQRVSGPLAGEASAEVAILCLEQLGAAEMVSDLACGQLGLVKDRGADLTERGW